MNKNELMKIISMLPAEQRQSYPLLLALQISYDEELGKIYSTTYKRVMKHIRDVRPGDTARYINLLSEIEAELNNMGARQLYLMNNAMFNAYTLGMQNNLTGVYQSPLITANLTYLDKSKVEAAIKRVWNDKHYSDRIWANKEALKQYVRSDILAYVIGGTDRRTLITNLADKMNVTRNRATTLVRTESMAYYSNGTIEKYKNSGITAYKYLAALDSRTSETCAELNGKEFSVNAARIGVNMPPMHPNCRSTIVPSQWGGMPL